MKEENNIKNLLEARHQSLTQEKRDALWSAIEADIRTVPIPSPFLFTLKSHTKKIMTPLALVLALALGVGGTTYASNDARPGDLLFPVDKAVEDVLLALALDDENRVRLQIAAAEERLAELRSILDEDEVDDDRITTTVSLIDASLNDSQMDDDERERLLESLKDQFSSGSERIESDDDRIEIRSDDDRSEVRYDDDDTEIRIKNDDDSDDTDDRAEDTNENDRDTDDDTQQTSFEAEADVYTDRTVVEIELNDRKTIFTTTADTRNEVIDEIVSRFAIDRATVESGLDFEKEDWTSREEESERDEKENDDDSSGKDRRESDDQNNEDSVSEDDETEDEED